MYGSLKFDIKEFYPSISEDLLNKAIHLAHEFVILSEKEKKSWPTVRNPYRSIETRYGQKDKDSNIGIGSYNDAEVSELVKSF